MTVGVELAAWNGISVYSSSRRLINVSLKCIALMRAMHFKESSRGAEVNLPPVFSASQLDIRE